MANITVGTNSYVTEAELTTYATDRGITIASADKTVLLIKAMDYIETRQYKGSKTLTDQALQFPRILDDYISYPYNEVPSDVKKAQMVASLLIDSGNDLQPVHGRSARREKVDVIEIEYEPSSPFYNQYTSLDDLLRPFLQSGIRGIRV